jgi:hypothetical protein
MEIKTQKPCANENYITQKIAKQTLWHLDDKHDVMMVLCCWVYVC